MLENEIDDYACGTHWVYVDIVGIIYQMIRDSRYVHICIYAYILRAGW